MRRIAIDFDGTLVEDLGNEMVWDINRYTVKDGAKGTIDYLKQDGWPVVVFTARTDDRDKPLIEAVLARAGIEVDDIFCGGKPHAAVYIDDKALRFESWAKTREWLKRHVVEKQSHIGQQPISEYEQTLRNEKIAKLVPADTNRILDIGCGDGSVWNSVRIDILDGVDTDYEMRIRARDSGFNAVYESVCSLPEDSMYSLVTCFGVLEHVDDEAGFLRSLSRFNNLVITVPNADSFHRYVGKEVGVIKALTDTSENDLQIGHQRYYTYREFMLLMATFAGSYRYSLEMGTIGFKITSNDGMLPFFDVASAINNAARDIGWIGKDAQHGAEIYAKLWR